MSGDTKRLNNAVIGAEVLAQRKHADAAAAGHRRYRVVALCHGCAQQIEELAGLTGRSETR